MFINKYYKLFEDVHDLYNYIFYNNIYIYIYIYITLVRYQLYIFLKDPRYLKIFFFHTMYSFLRASLFIDYNYFLKLML